jgi:SAM-dependent methyltransferase
MNKHLDLGCGLEPKNPYNADMLYGIDIRAHQPNISNAIIVSANLAIDPIPFHDSHFDSVSAYDFFEHIPRVALDLTSRTSTFPFVKLMDEIWRVLRPGGLMYAVTPAFPSEKALRDPTHVNIITAKTYRYFTAPHLLGKMYGFNGGFKVIRHTWIHPRGEYEPVCPPLLRTIRNLTEYITGERSHLLWEFEAIK